MLVDAVVSSPSLVAAVMAAPAFLAAVGSAVFLVARALGVHGHDQVLEVIITHGTHLLRTCERCFVPALVNAVVPFAVCAVNAVGSSPVFVVAALALLVPEE